MAVVLAPAISDPNADFPNATLEEPVVRASPAKAPNATLSVPLG